MGFLILRESRFVCSQLMRKGISLLILFSRFDKVVPEVIKLESSANKIGFNLPRTAPKSFIYKRNNNGPIIDPEGPHR